MNAEVTIVFVQRLQNRHVRGILNNLVDPLDCFDHLTATKKFVCNQLISEVTPRTSYTSDKRVRRLSEGAEAV